MVEEEYSDATKYFNKYLQIMHKCSARACHLLPPFLGTIAGSTEQFHAARVPSLLDVKIIVIGWP